MVSIAMEEPEQSKDESQFAFDPPEYDGLSLRESMYHAQEDREWQSQIEAN